MSDEVKKPSTGPFVLEDGVKSDREYWSANMDPKEESMFDDYLLIKSVEEESRKEIARREGQAAFESLMEAFKNY